VRFVPHPLLWNTLALACSAVSLPGQRISFCFCGAGEKRGWVGEETDGWYCIRGGNYSFLNVNIGFIFAAFNVSQKALEMVIKKVTTAATGKINQ